MIDRKPKGFSIIATLSLVIFLLGLLGILLINAAQLNDHIKQNIELTIYFNTDLRLDQSSELSDSIILLPYVDQGKFTSSEQAIFDFKNEIGDDFIEILGDNPLPSSLTISIKKEFSDEASLFQIDRDLSNSKGVMEVAYPKNVFQQIDENRRIISFWLVILSVILILIAVALMVNTVKIMVHSDRFIIKTQQLIGAKPTFIQKPYQRRALIWTLISFVIGLVLLVALLFSLFTWLDITMDINMSAIRNHFAEKWYLYFLMLLLLLVGAAMVIFISTHLATKKYLNTDTERLYI